MVDDAHRRAREELHAALKVLRKGPFSFHGLLRHLAHFVEAACGKGHVVDAFVFDQGAVHVEEECLEGLDAESCRKDEEVGIVPGGFRLKVREVGIVGDILKTKRRFGRTIKRACGVHFMREVEEQIVLQLCAGDHNVEHGGFLLNFSMRGQSSPRGMSEESSAVALQSTEMKSPRFRNELAGFCDRKRPCGLCFLELSEAVHPLHAREGNSRRAVITSSERRADGRR